VVEVSIIESHQVIEDRGFDMLRQTGQYLWSASKRQLLMNGLAEAGGYSKFSQHRCRIACHQQLNRWWRFHREFM
jgi:hypothetical protein